MHITVNDTRLFFDVEGAKLVPEGPTMREKPTLLLLHGGPGVADHSMFKPAFSALADIAQIVYLDHRGNGRSGRDTPEHWNLQQWAEDVRAFCEALQISAPIVMGTSLGGMVAIVYAARFPDHPCGLILDSTTPRGSQHLERQQRILEVFERIGGPKIREIAQRAVQERTPEARAEFREICRPLYTRQPLSPDASKRTVEHLDVVHWFGRPGGEEATMDLTSKLAAIRCPVLVMVGEDDPVTPLSESEEILRCLKRPGRFERFADCGHGVFRDQPLRAINAIREFVLTVHAGNFG
jgi:proline iminopeptidase